MIDTMRHTLTNVFGSIGTIELISWSNGAEVFKAGCQLIVALIGVVIIIQKYFDEKKNREDEHPE